MSPHYKAEGHCPHEDPMTTRTWLVPSAPQERKSRGQKLGGKALAPAGAGKAVSPGWHPHLGQGKYLLTVF